MLPKHDETAQAMMAGGDGRAGSDAAETKPAEGDAPSGGSPSGRPSLEVDGPRTPAGAPEQAQFDLSATSPGPGQARPGGPEGGAAADRDEVAGETQRGEAGGPPRRRRLHVPKFLRRGATVIVLILVFEYIVIPRVTVAFSHNSIRRLEHVNFLLIILAFLCEVISLFAYAKLTVVVLPPKSLPLSKAWRINLASLTVSHVIPGGTAGGTGLSIRLMTTEGLNISDVGFATAMQGLGSAVLLNVLLWVAIIISIPFNGFNPAYVSVAIVSVIVFGFFAALVAGFASGEGWAVKVLRRLADRFHFIPREKVERFVKQLAERLQAAGRNPNLIRRGLAWAAVNWLFDAACLYVWLWALGYPMNPVDLMVAYGVGNVLAAIPITPGGLGLTEAGAIGVLTAFHVPAAVAALGVLGWRLFNFWVPIPVGAICYMSLGVRRGASLKERRTAITSMTQVARDTESVELGEGPEADTTEPPGPPDVPKRRPSGSGRARDHPTGHVVPPVG